MDEKTLNEGKKAFISGLYRYKEQEINLIDNSKTLNKALLAIQDCGALTDIKVHDINQMIKNKYNFLINEVLRKNFDLLLFKDYDAGDYYPSNFFIGEILDYYVIMMDEIQDEFLEFVTALEKFSDRLLVISKKRFKVLKAFLEGKPYY